MGILRLVLSALVVLCHLNWRPLGINPGPVAVVMFFVISGFVMTALVSKYYLRLALVPAFYKDRLLRLYPQFALYLALAIAVLPLLPIPDYPPIVVTPRVVLLNALVIPCDFWTVVLPDGGLYVPPAWSLGLEATFYLTFPFILILRLRGSAMLLSLTVFALAYCGLLDTDLWGVRWLPGTLFMFLLGSYLYTHRDRGLPRIAVLVWLAALPMLAVVLIGHRFVFPWNSDVLIGLLAGIPAVWLLRRQPSGMADRWAGNLSYGVFLNHYTVMLIGRTLGLPALGAASLAGLFAVSLAAAALSYRFIEAPMIARRRSLRSRVAIPSGA